MRLQIIEDIHTNVDCSEPPVSGAVWNEAQFRWEVECATVEDLLRFAVEVDKSVLLTPAVGDDEGDLHIVEFVEREQLLKEID